MTRWRLDEKNRRYTFLTASRLFYSSPPPAPLPHTQALFPTLLFPKIGDQNSNEFRRSNSNQDKAARSHIPDSFVFSQIRHVRSACPFLPQKWTRSLGSLFIEITCLDSTKTKPPENTFSSYITRIYTEMCAALSFILFVANFMLLSFPFSLRYYSLFIVHSSFPFFLFF